MGQVTIFGNNVSKYSLFVSADVLGPSSIMHLSSKYIGKTTSDFGGRTEVARGIFEHRIANATTTVDAILRSVDSGYNVVYKFKNDGPIMGTLELDKSMELKQTDTTEYYFDVVKI